MKGEEPIFIVDNIVTLPGRGRDVHRLYMSEYVPGSSARGLLLCHAWVSPPVWIEAGHANTLTYVWSVNGVSGYWAAEGMARWDSTTPDFWRSLETMIQHRTRKVMAEADDIESLCDV